MLAPMEGVIDYNMRQILTRIGGFDRCVTEFVRVTTHAVPQRVFHRYCPELESGGMTGSGVPVYIQLLGGDPALMAESAVIAVTAGAPGIDINFGCPAKIVNRHDGGSVLLKEPQRVFTIVEAIRQAIDPAIPVCAKIRLGFNNADLLAELVGAASNAGASELCIHARTRSDGYRPPAYWSAVGALDYDHDMPLVVNGEIWNPQDARQACQQSNCENLMLGRGALAWPDLAKIVRYRDTGEHPVALTWANIVGLVDQFFHHQDSTIPRYTGNRTKQWLGYLRRRYPGANRLFIDIRRLTDRNAISTAIYQHRRQLDKPAETSAPCLSSRQNQGDLSYA